MTLEGCSFHTAISLVSQARFYYLAAAYRMLFAGGAVAIEGWLSLISPRPARAVQGVSLAAFVLSGVAFEFGRCRSRPSTPRFGTWRPRSTVS